MAATIVHRKCTAATVVARKPLRSRPVRERATTVLAILITLIVCVVPVCDGQQKQKFRVTPTDLQVLEGAEALLRCEVANLGGQVQWTKDGFALGFQAVIPGFPRYSVLGDRSQGVYNLRLSNVSMEDDAEYQCQVGPAKYNVAIRANARLTVFAPPSSLLIEGHSHNTKVEVRQNQELSLVCVAANSRPATQLKWFRGNTDITKDAHTETNSSSSDKRFTTISRLQWTPTMEDDLAEYSCQAKHRTLKPDMPLRAAVQLSVLYPPGAPYIEGYTPGETLRRGQVVELVCRSRGGNPPAQLIWYKNGVQTRMAYRTAGRLSENVYTFTVEAADNKARLRCEASNVMSQTPLKTEIDLTVLFAPTHVSISGPSEARVGDQVALQCTTAPSNPPAEIRWTVGGQPVKNATAKTLVSSEGGWLTNSNITELVEPNKRSLVAVCHGLNMHLTENVVATHTVNVLYPPSAPIISGYAEGSIIPAGSVQRLLCVSSGGNPLATLTWYKNDKKISSAIKATDKMVSAELQILANVTDNLARYRCEAQNSATEIPLFESKILSVHFAPETVKIRIEPIELKPGDEATLFCDSSSSNPPAVITWWRDGISVAGLNNSTKSGLWGGTVSSNELKVNVTQEMNGVVYTCQSQNEALQRSVHEAITLEVLYRPFFTPPPSSTVVGIEGEPLQVAMMATANPLSIAFTWTKDGQPIIASQNGVQRIVSEGPILNITKLMRSDAGVYTCEAVNSQGSALINISIVVEYGATITAISENIVVNPDEDATLSCTADGKPLSDEHIRWERLAYELPGKTTTTFANGTSFLHIKNANREDVGNFRCVADNRVSNPTSRDVLLIVKFAPEIDKSPPLLRAASSAGDRGRLPCRAQSAPRPTFAWTRNGQTINVNQTSKYFVEHRQIDPLTYESTLLVERVAASDYGVYECLVKNELGTSSEHVRLDVTSQPDPPLNLNILNTTHESVSFSWTPGFDGGMKASYRIRYREASSEHYRYEDSLPNTHKLTIAGLKPYTVYLFSIMASNVLGNSRYLPDLVKVQTKEIPLPSQPASSLGEPPTTNSPSSNTTSGLLLLVSVASGTAVVLLNVLLIGCCLHRRTQKRIKRGSEKLPVELYERSDLPNVVIISISIAGLILLLINGFWVTWFVVRKRKRESAAQNSKSATIEMYAPSSYNDTVTGETLSSVSEKSDSYSNDGSQQDYMDEQRKKAASSYLVDNPDIPPPRYQQDGTLPTHYTINTVNSMHTRTLPHARHTTTHLEPKARDDQTLMGKVPPMVATYIPAPSPGPPMDGSYYNMNSDRYLSYPSMVRDYPQVEFSGSPVPLTMIGAAQHNNNNMVGNNNLSGGTLRRGNRALVPPPDVTYNTGHSKSTHDLHNTSVASQTSSSLSGGGVGGGGGGGSIIGVTNNNNSVIGPHGIPPHPPMPGILKDPKRLQQQQQQHQHQQHQHQHQQQQQQAHHHANMQILSVQNAQANSMGGGGGGGVSGVGVSVPLQSQQQQLAPTSATIANSLYAGASFDPSRHNLSSFNASMGYTDADGHLV